MKKPYEDLRDEVLGLFVKAVREGVVERLDLLPGKVLGEPVECKPAGDHLVEDAP